MEFKDIKSFADRYESISIYGSGEIGKALLEVLKDSNIKVVAFIVSDNQAVLSSRFSGLPIYALSCWIQNVKTAQSGILVSVSKSYQEEIVKNLEANHLSDYLVVSNEALHESMRRLHPVNPENFIHTINPVSRGFGSERGKPIDRVYIEGFLREAAQKLRDVRAVLEVGSDAYSRRFFQSSAELIQYDVLRYDCGMDLTDVSTLPPNKYDVFVCTQVFNFIYDVKAAVRGSYYLLKPGGTLLVTVQGNVGQVSRTDMKLWGDYWRFTDLGIGKLISEVFGELQVKVYPYGNAFSATAFVQGMALEDIPDTKLLEPVESEYAICIGVIAQKKGQLS